MKGKDLDRILRQTDVPLEQVYKKTGLVKNTLNSRRRASEKEVEPKIIQKLLDGGVDIFGIGEKIGVENIQKMKETYLGKNIHNLEFSNSDESTKIANANQKIEELKKEVSNLNEIIDILTDYIKVLKLSQESNNIEIPTDTHGESNKHSKGDSKGSKSSNRQTGKRNQDA